MNQRVGNIQRKRHSISRDFDVMLQVLGTGVSGKVLKCTRKSDRKQFALKILKDNDRSRREVEVHYHCAKRSRYVVDVEDVYENIYEKEKCLLLVMECMHGGELFTRIQNRCDKPFTEREAALIIYQITCAVRDLHSMGVAHRDLKPENFLCSEKSSECALKLTDFGFAKFVETEKPLQTPCYTPYYVAPEVIAHEPYDKSCDMWSIGVIMYIILCGYPPFYSTSNQPMSPGMKAKIRSGSFSFPEADWSNISSSAKWTIENLLKTDPKERFTIAQLFESPWIKNCLTIPATPLRTVEVLMKTDDWDNMMANLKGVLSSMRPEPSPTFKLRDLDEAFENTLLMRRRQKNETGKCSEGKSNA